MPRSVSMFIANCSVLVLFLVLSYVMPATGGGLIDALVAVAAALVVLSVPWAVAGVLVGARELRKADRRWLCGIGLVGNLGYLTLVVAIVWDLWRMIAWRMIAGA